jgi:ATP phosphoribosyltransferase regulatory subunit HisZ
MNDLAALGLPLQARKQLLLLLSQADEAGAEALVDASAVPSPPSWTTELQRSVFERVLREEEALGSRIFHLHQSEQIRAPRWP